MEILIVIFLILWVVFFCLPAFMLLWESAGFFEMGCYGWLCIIVGFPGALLALLIKTVFVLPKEQKAQRERWLLEQERLNEQRNREELERNKQAQYQRDLEEKRNRIYPNSPITMEIVGIMSQNSRLPYAVDINYEGLTFYFENSTLRYIFRAHGLSNMDENEQQVFAEVLNQRLQRRYAIRKMTKLHSFNYSNGELGAITVYLGVKMELIPTNSF